MPDNVFPGLLQSPAGASGDCLERILGNLELDIDAVRDPPGDAAQKDSAIAQLLSQG